jgi:Gluconate 2-dehydrogenase subunit 3
VPKASFLCFLEQEFRRPPGKSHFGRDRESESTVRGKVHNRQGRVLVRVGNEARSIGHKHRRLSSAAQAALHRNLKCSPAEQKQILHLIAYRANGETDPSLGPGTSFFSLLRELTADGFFTSKIGVESLGYMGNTYLLEFPACPPVPGL